MKTEIWKEILDGDYEISNLGNLRRLKKSRGTWPGRPLIGNEGKKGYIEVALGKDSNGKVRTAYLHVLVAEAFLGPCPPDKEVNHKNGIKKHCELSNLEYKTHKENQEHAAKTGLMARGENVGSSKLKNRQVKEIRVRALTESKYALAKEFGVCAQTIYNIVAGKTWK